MRCTDTKNLRMLCCCAMHIGRQQLATKRSANGVHTATLIEKAHCSVSAGIREMTRIQAMKQVYVKYNPYRLETEIKINGKNNARFQELGTRGTRIQEWVEEFPQVLMEEGNDTQFDIVFHGTQMDYEDVVAAFMDACEHSDLEVQLRQEPGREVTDKEQKIEEIFEDIQEGPIAELRDPRLAASFRQAMSQDFEVCVVATMSAGKSTLINAMLRDKLPSKQEACTAVITRIKDENRPDFRAEVLDKAGRTTEVFDPVTYDDMDQANADPSAATVKLYGRIPFLDDEREDSAFGGYGLENKSDSSLVLVDTPGPNNARNDEHTQAQQEFLSESSKSLILFLMEGAFGKTDDDVLLRRIAKSMSAGGKQAKDRFIFVINKVDSRQKEDGSPEDTLNKVREYLAQYGIENPNLFPVAALPALNIRRMLRNPDVLDEDELDEVETVIRRLNRNENFHLEKWGVLPPSLQQGVGRALVQAAESSEDPRNDPNTVLIHTGIISLETAIGQYVRKYANTAKIKNIVDTFMQVVESGKCENDMRLRMAQSAEECAAVEVQIGQMRKKVSDAQEAASLEGIVRDAVEQSEQETLDAIEEISARMDSQLCEARLRGSDVEIPVSEAQAEVDRLRNYFMQTMKPSLEADLQTAVTNGLMRTANALVDEYKKKIGSLRDENWNEVGDFVVDPLILMDGAMSLDLDVWSLATIRRVENGSTWMPNEAKRPEKFWTWFQEDGRQATAYKYEPYVRASEVQEKLLDRIKDVLTEDIESAKTHVRTATVQIMDAFMEQFANINLLLADKMDSLMYLTQNHVWAQKDLEEAQQKAAWFTDISDRMAEILDI